MTTATMTLTDFLLARIAEDEERAEFVRRQNEGPWNRPLEPWKLSWHDEYDLLCIEPSRALAECEAKRAIIDRCERDMVADGESVSGYDIVAHTDALARDTLEFLALPYADHPDYDEAWRP